VYLIQQPLLEGAAPSIAAAGRLATAAAVGASFCSSIAMIGLHRLSHLDVRAIVVHFSFVSLLFVVAAFFVFDHGASLEALREGTTPYQLIGVGLSATIGQFFLTKAFTTGEPAKVSVVGLTQVGFGMLFDVLLWHRAFTPQTVLGMILVVGPTAWMMWRRS
jgi:drug/metabolite transporter (DMT)-like permease